jgi:hypothetical protein
VLNDVALRPFLEQPAGKGAAPFLVIAQHVHLHEGPGFGHLFPRRGSFAGAQADNGMADAERLARLHVEVAGDPVALVQYPDHRFPLRHRRAGQFGEPTAARRHISRVFHPYRVAVRLIVGGKPVAASGEQQQGRQGCSGQLAHLCGSHDASGLQAS